MISEKIRSSWGGGLVLTVLLKSSTYGFCCKVLWLYAIFMVSICFYGFLGLLYSQFWRTFPAWPHTRPSWGSRVNFHMRSAGKSMMTGTFFAERFLSIYRLLYIYTHTFSCCRLLLLLLLLLYILLISDIALYYYHHDYYYYLLVCYGYCCYYHYYNDYHYHYDHYYHYSQYDHYYYHYYYYYMWWHIIFIIPLGITM